MIIIIKDTIFRIEVFKEEGRYIALSLELNVSSFGDSPEEAKASLTEAISLFLEECEQMGTLNEVMEEAGFNRLNKHVPQWVAREIVLQ